MRNEISKPTVKSEDVPNIKLVLADPEKVLGKLIISLPSLIPLRSWKEDLRTFDQTRRHGEDAHQKCAILRTAYHAALGDRNKFLR
jgi:hypothetical protein